LKFRISAGETGHRANFVRAPPMASFACDPKADDSFHLVPKLRVQQPSSQVHFFYRLRREHVAAECALALTGGQK
jgi:hypothetical protein